MYENGRVQSGGGPKLSWPKSSLQGGLCPQRWVDDADIPGGVVQGRLLESTEGLQRRTVPEMRRGGGDLYDGRVQRSSRTITGGGRAEAGHPTAEKSSQLRNDLKHTALLWP
jgi:hypothetical protein